MVNVEHQQRSAQIILRPNCSADWQSNRRLIAFIAAANCVFASGFIAIGAWLILPFMGLEILLLWLLLRRVFGRLQFQQVVKLDDDQLIVESGYHHLRQNWRWQRDSATVLVNTRPHPWDPLHISLSHAGEEIALGRFLNKDDTEILLRALRREGLAIRQFSEYGDFIA